MKIVLQGEIIRLRRREKRLTQEALAEICNCSQRHLSDLENGNVKRPSAAIVWQLAKALGISMEEVMLMKEELE